MKKQEYTLRVKRHKRIRLMLKPSSERPRMVVRRSLNNIFAQVIDDVSHKTLFSFSSTDKEIREKFANSGNVKSAAFCGEVCARRAKEKGIEQIVFDRAGYLYHGRIKAFAEGLRKGGLKF
ncbi:MAG: 50S ribosomal protein L18 [Candidatus Omnitrophica bacterium]|nr:50S ribosomal protein L18 [Candidatus Omnitrophota bacterium]